MNYVPTHCPSCGSELVWSEKGTDLLCLNRKECPEQTFYFVEYFIKMMGSEGISVQTLRNLEVNTVEKLFAIDLGYISKREGFGKRSGEKILTEIARLLKGKKVSTIIAAFGINGIGQKNAEKIAEFLAHKARYEKETDDPDVQMELFFSLNQDEFMDGIEGVGEKTYENYSTDKERCQELYNFLVMQGLSLKVEAANIIQSDSELNGKLIVLTGAGPVGRNALVAQIQSLGGFVKDSVNKKTNILVCEDSKSNSSKMKNARKMPDIRIMQYSDFIDEFLK